MKLHIAENLWLPVDAVTQRLAFLGRTGSGKTYAAQRAAEEMIRANGQVVILDPVGVWYSLRIAADGKSPGIPIPVFGGLHGDVPLEATAGGLIADLVVDRGISAVIDVSQFEFDTDKNRFAAAFAARFFFRKKAAPSAVMFLIEECQEFIPENPGKGEPLMLHHFTRLVKIGRNFGIGIGLISQRPQEVSKKVLNMTECLFAFQMTGPHERKAVKLWVADKGGEVDIVDLLPKLEVGQCHVWSPQWLKISETVRISPKWTFNASSAPAVGAAKRTEPKPLEAADLDALRQSMAATIERAKAEDPKELRKRIAELERDLKKKPAPAAAPSPAKTQRVEVPVLKDAQVKRLETVVQKLQRATEPVLELGREISGILLNLAAKQERLDSPPPPPNPRVVRGTPDFIGDRHQTTQSHQTIPARPPREPRPQTSADGSVTRPQQRILDGLAWLESIGLGTGNRNIVGFLGDASPKSSAFMNNLSALRTLGLLDYPTPGDVRLTDAGRSAAAAQDSPLSSQDLHAKIFEKLPNPQCRILKVLIAHRGSALSREAVAQKAGASPASSAFMNNLSALRSLGLLDYPQQGYVRAEEILFLEGV